MYVGGFLKAMFDNENPPVSEFDDGFAAGFTISGSFIEESVESDFGIKSGVRNILSYQFPKTL